MNLSSQHLVIDTETLALRDNAIVLSIAVTPFYFNESTVTYNELVERSFFVKLDAKAQGKKGRVADKKTLVWWGNQPETSKVFAFNKSPDDVDPREGLVQLKKFIRDKTEYSHNNSYVFERGMGYDTNKLDSLCEMYELGCPLNLWRARELRTINDLVGDVENGKWELPEGRPHNFIEHHALHDAALDAYRLIKMFSI